MSRKDYIIIANALRLAKPKDKGMAGLDVWYSAIRMIATALQVDNSAFDKDKFIKACEP